MRTLMKGTLILVPNTLGGKRTDTTIPDGVYTRLKGVRTFIVEDIRNARRFLKKLDPGADLDSIRFLELNKHTPSGEVTTYLEDADKGFDTALLSEAGIPCVADPGALVVGLAHSKGIRVVPLTGPSSIFLALMASGLNGQSFTFLGYLPVKRNERIRRIREIEPRTGRANTTQIFIETPYRNDSLLRDLLQVCHPDTRLCIAADLTMESEYIRTCSIGEWKKEIPELHKRPVVFLLGS